MTTARCLVLPISITWAIIAHIPACWAGRLGIFGATIGVEASLPLLRLVVADRRSVSRSPGRSSPANSTYARGHDVARHAPAAAMETTTDWLPQIAAHFVRRSRRVLKRLAIHRPQRPHYPPMPLH